MALVTRYIRQVTSRKSAVILARAMAEYNFNQIQDAEWVKSAITESTMPPLNLTTNPLDPAYDAFKYVSDYVAGEGKTRAYLGMVAYRISIPQDAFDGNGDARVTFTSVTAELFTDKWLVEGVRIAVVPSDDPDPSSDWATIRGDATGIEHISGELAVTPGDPRVNQEETITFSFTGTNATKYLYIYLSLEDMVSVSPNDDRHLYGGALLVGDTIAIVYSDTVAEDPENTGAMDIAMIASEIYRTENTTITPAVSLARTSDLRIDSSEVNYAFKYWHGLLRNWSASIPNIVYGFTLSDDTEDTVAPLSFTFNYWGMYKSDDIIVHVFDNKTYNDPCAIIRIPAATLGTQRPVSVWAEAGVDGVTVTGSLPRKRAWFFAFVDIDANGHYNLESPQGVTYEPIDLTQRTEPVWIDMYDTGFVNGRYNSPGDGDDLDGRPRCYGRASEMMGFCGNAMPVVQWVDNEHEHGIGATYGILFLCVYNHYVTNGMITDENGTTYLVTLDNPYWEAQWWGNMSVSFGATSWESLKPGYSSGYYIRNRNYMHIGDFLNVSKGWTPFHAGKDFSDDMNDYVDTTMAYGLDIDRINTENGGAEKSIVTHSSPGQYEIGFGGHPLATWLTGFRIAPIADKLATPNVTQFPAGSISSHRPLVRVSGVDPHAAGLTIVLYNNGDRKQTLYYPCLISPDGTSLIQLPWLPSSEPGHSWGALLNYTVPFAFGTTVAGTPLYTDSGYNLHSDSATTNYTIVSDEALPEYHPQVTIANEGSTTLGAGFLLRGAYGRTQGIADCALFGQAHIPSTITSVALENPIPAYDDWLRLRWVVYFVPLTELRANNYRYSHITLSDDMYHNNDLWLGTAESLSLYLDDLDTPSNVPATAVLTIDLAPEGYAAGYIFDIEPLEVYGSFMLYSVISPIAVTYAASNVIAAGRIISRDLIYNEHTQLPENAVVSIGSQTISVNAAMSGLSGKELMDEIKARYDALVTSTSDTTIEQLTYTGSDLLHNGALTAYKDYVSDDITLSVTSDATDVNANNANRLYPTGASTDELGTRSVVNVVFSTDAKLNENDTVKFGDITLTISADQAAKSGSDLMCSIKCAYENHSSYGTSNTVLNIAALSTTGNSVLRVVAVGESADVTITSNNTNKPVVETPYNDASPTRTTITVPYDTNTMLFKDDVLSIYGVQFIGDGVTTGATLIASIVTNYNDAKCEAVGFSTYLQHDSTNNTLYIRRDDTNGITPNPHVDLYCQGLNKILTPGNVGLYTVETGTGTKYYYRHARVDFAGATLGYYDTIEIGGIVVSIPTPNLSTTELITYIISTYNEATRCSLDAFTLIYAPVTGEYLDIYNAGDDTSVSVSISSSVSNPPRIVAGGSSIIKSAQARTCGGILYTSATQLASGDTVKIGSETLTIAAPTDALTGKDLMDAIQSWYNGQGTSDVIDYKPGSDTQEGILRIYHDGVDPVIIHINSDTPNRPQAFGQSVTDTSKFFGISDWHPRVAYLGNRA